MLGGHRRQECLSCHREAVGIPGILPRVEGRCASKSTIVLNSCFLMDSRNRHSLLESLKTIGRNEQQFIPFAIRSSSSGNGRFAGKQCLSLSFLHRCLLNYPFLFSLFISTSIFNIYIYILHSLRKKYRVDDINENRDRVNRYNPKSNFDSISFSRFRVIFESNESRAGPQR